MNSEIIGLKALVNDVNKNVLEGASSSDARDKQILESLSAIQSLLGGTQPSSSQTFSGERDTGIYTSFENWIRYVGDKYEDCGYEALDNAVLDESKFESLNQKVIIDIPCKDKPKLVIFGISSSDIKTQEITSGDMDLIVMSEMDMANLYTLDGTQRYRTANWLMKAMIFPQGLPTGAIYAFNPAAHQSEIPYKQVKGILSCVDDNPIFNLEDVPKHPGTLLSTTTSQIIGMRPIFNVNLTEEENGRYTLSFEIPAIHCGQYDYYIYY